MAAALVYAIRHPAVVRAQAEHGRRIVVETYDWNVMARKLETVWEKCLSSPAALAPAARCRRADCD